MEKTSMSPLQAALEAIEQLPPEEQETVIELVRHRLAEKRRAEIADRATATLQAVREGRAQFGSIEDLKRDLDE